MCDGMHRTHAPSLPRHALSLTPNSCLLNRPLSHLQEKYGQFYGGDCYVLLYTYIVGEKDMYIIYFWQVTPSVL